MRTGDTRKIAPVKAKISARRLTAPLVMMARLSDDPQKTFHRELHSPEVLEVIFRNSAAHRDRLKRYMQREMQLEEGDTVVLADTGYMGVTQDYLTRAFADELNIEILGRYVIASHEPNRPAASKALITTTWCDHSLFEQSCTFREGAVVNYDAEGQPVFREPWQAQAFAMAVDLHARGYFTWTEWSATLADEIQRAQAAGDPGQGVLEP